MHSSLTDEAGGLGQWTHYRAAHRAGGGAESADGGTQAQEHKPKIPDLNLVCRPIVTCSWLSI